MNLIFICRQNEVLSLQSQRLEAEGYILHMVRNVTHGDLDRMGKPLSRLLCFCVPIKM